MNIPNFAYSPQTYSRRMHSSPYRLIRLCLIGALVCLIALTVFKTIRLCLFLLSAYDSGVKLAQTLNTDEPMSALSQAAPLLEASATALAGADREMRFFRPLLERLAWVPTIGPTVAALPGLLEVGHGLAAVAVTTQPLIEPWLTAPANATLSTLWPALLEKATPQLPLLIQQAAAMEKRLAPIEPTQLLPLVAKPVAGLKAGVTFLGLGLRISPQLPTLAGLGQPRRLLVLAQNNHELRGTGGFITAVGQITITEGRIDAVEFVDSYDPQISRTDKVLPRAAGPVQRFMGIENMLLRDANWSPDLPTTARIISLLYFQQTGQPIDGIITVDLQALELFVTALAPLPVTGVDEPITQANLQNKIREFWASPLESEARLASGDKEWWEQRKAFIPRLATTILDRFQRGAFDKLTLATTMRKALDARALQLWFANPVVAAELAHLHWDGGLHAPAQGDFLALVDSNFGYNKVDAVLERSIHYFVEWPTGTNEPAIATATISYQHPAARPGYACDQKPHYEQSYEEMMARCYFDYIRLYTAAGSELLAVDGILPESLSNQRSDGNLQLFGGYFVLPPGAETKIVFRYRLPADITPENYRLTLQRQSGARPLPFTANVAGALISTTVETGRFEWQVAGGK